jgi:hypothetical protein
LVAIIALLLIGMRGFKSVLATGPGAAALGAATRSAAVGVPESELPPLGPPPEAVRLKNKVVEETSTRPELMAQVVRAWMAEG